MKDDLRKILPWLALPLVVAALAIFGTARDDRSLVGQPAPSFELTIRAGDGAAEGDRVALTHLVGHPVLLDFWASWCGPCRRSTPVLNEVHERYKGQGLRAYGINVEAALSPRPLVQAHRLFGARFPSVQDDTGELQRLYRVRGLPTIVLVDSRGLVADIFVGVPRASELDEAVSALVGRRGHD